MSIEAMKQALDALNGTDTHPLSSAEQYFKETQAMEALEDAIKEAEEREWQGLTDEDMAELRRDGAHSVSDKDFRAIEAKLREKNL